MPEEVKFNEEELKQVEEIQKKYIDIQQQFGQISVARLRIEDQLINIDKDEERIQTDFSELQSKERDFLKGITEKYGQGSLNPETGVFTPNKS
jgi:predicted nuclease with TOPRIM domain